MSTYPAYKVAAAHVAPVFLDLKATVDKTCSLIEEAARNNAQLVVFPETYAPAFPIWCSLRAPIRWRWPARSMIVCPISARDSRP